jgi:hypothetical protein
LINIAGTTTPMSVTVNSSDSPPLAGLANIADGETVYGTIPVEVTASDDSGVSRVDLFVDTSLIQGLTAPPFTFLLDTTVLSNGTRTLRAVVYDTILQSSTASVSVNVDNIFPPLSLKAARAINRSLLLREYVNILTWRDDPRNLSVSKFRIYRVTGLVRALIAEVPRTTANAAYRFLHRKINGQETYTYDVVGVGNLDRESAAATATVR